MKKRILASCISIAIATSLITGCNIADKINDIKEVTNSENAQVDRNNNENEQSAKDEKTVLDNLIDENVVESSGDSNPDNGTENKDTDNTTNPDDSSEQSSMKQTISGAPTYKIISKKYNTRYDGDVKFPDDDGNCKDYSDGILYKGTKQTIMMDDEWESIYPALYKTLKDEAQKEMESFDKWADQTTSEAKGQYEDCAQNGYSFYGPFSDEDELMVKRSDSIVFSVYSYNSEYTGGVHGMYGANGQNYDVESGKKLDIGDVVTVPESELNKIILEKLHEIEEYEGQFSLAEDSGLSDYKYNAVFDLDSGVYEYEYKWYFAGDGLHIIFNPYEIASYADGMQDIVIGYEEHDGLIADKYIPKDSNGFCMKENIFLIDEKYDSDQQSLHFRYVHSANDPEDDDLLYGDDFGLALANGKYAYTDSGFCINENTTLEAYRIGTTDGKEYIYVIIPDVNDYYKLHVFDITGDDVKFAGTQWYHYMEERLDGGFRVEPIQSDPYNLRFGDVMGIFGTFTCYSNYEVGADGLPVKISDDYKIVWKSEDAYSKSDIKADIVNEDGTTAEGDVTVPSGSHFIPYRTDGEKYIDCMLDDGRIARLYYISVDYPVQLQEGEIDDLFDGLIYAG